MAYRQCVQILVLTNVTNILHHRLLTTRAPQKAGRIPEPPKVQTDSRTESTCCILDICIITSLRVVSAPICTFRQHWRPVLDSPRRFMSVLYYHPSIYSLLQFCPSFLLSFPARRASTSTSVSKLDRHRVRFRHGRESFGL